MNQSPNSSQRLSPSLRESVVAADRELVRQLVAATGFFRDDELHVAVELVDERMHKGLASGYHFLFADVDGRTAGYACYGPIACTVGSWDLYWIVVDPRWQGRGLGQALVSACEQRIQAAGGRRIYIETSGRPQYAPTRAFYRRCGYELAAELTDFYDRGDDKVVWHKRIA